jgi:hypothetical protein
MGLVSIEESECRLRVVSGRLIESSAMAPHDLQHRAAAPYKTPMFIEYGQKCISFSRESVTFSTFFCHFSCKPVLTCSFYVSAVTPGFVVWPSSAGDFGEKVRTV